MQLVQILIPLQRKILMMLQMIIDISMWYVVCQKMQVKVSLLQRELLKCARSMQIVKLSLLIVDEHLLGMTNLKNG